MAQCRVLQEATLRKIGVLFAAAAVSGSAFAADMPVKAPPPPAVAPANNWTGLYIGANAGGVWERDVGNSNYNDPNTPANLTNNVQGNSLGGRAFIGGIQAGYNWQMMQWVFGIETDWDWTNVKNGFCRQTDVDSVACSDNGAGFITLNEKTEWLGSVRARVGYAWDRFMFYGTGGVAWGKIDTSINPNCLVAGCGFGNTHLNITSDFSNTRTGWVAGAGIEAVLNMNWTARVEYLHYDLGSFTNTFYFFADPGFLVSANWSRSFRYDAVLAGLSYKFGPVVAQY